MNLRCKFISKFSSKHCFTYCIAIIFIFFITNKGYSQSEVAAKPRLSFTDTSAPVYIIKNDTIKGDTILINDSLKKTKLAGLADTSKKSELERTLGIRISKDALSSTVTSVARDSAVLDIKNDMFFLYGKAQVNYEDLQLNAGQVVYAQSTNVVSAAPYEAAKDTSEKQTFSQGKEKFTYDSIQYNFKSKRAIVRNAHSQYGEGYMHSEQIKRNPDQTLYGAHSIYTTCALDTPHFGIYANKIKVIPNKLIVSGAANLRIESIPTPFYLPFALFPISQKQRSGFILPTYTTEEVRGLGLLNGGYYFYINDHVDLRAQANIYSKGSYGVSAVSSYNSIYHFNGGVNISYAYNKSGEDFEPGASVKKDFMVVWRHQSDGKSIPGQSFNASVQAGTSSYYANNSYDPNLMLQNQYQSNVSYSKNWIGTPLGLTVSALHNQNATTKQISITLPSLNFHVTQINPFQNKNAVGTHWYDKITTSYSMDMLNRTTFYDSTFDLSKLAGKDFQSGIHHAIPVSASYTVLRYVNMSFNVNYNEYWLTDKLYQQYDLIDRKTDSVDSRGFFAARSFDAGVSFSTRIYGMKLFRHGQLRGIRHVLSPTLGYTYHPDFANSPFNYYYKQRTDSVGNFVYQTPYVNSIVGYPPGPGKAGNVNMALNNNLQIKVRSKKDTVSGFKNVTLIDAFGIATAYNLAADSFQWSALGLSFRTSVLNKINVSSSANYDLYSFDKTTGRRLPQTMYDKGEGLARFTGATVAFGSNFHSKPKGGANSPTNSQEYARIMRNAGYNEYVDFNIPWSFNVSYSLTGNKSYLVATQKDTIVLSHSLTFQGEVQITTRWKVSMNSGYNFQAKQLTSTSIDIYRDLHCWTMHLQTIPFGPRKSYNFTINVKASVLQDLKLVKRRDYRDTPDQ